MERETGERERSLAPKKLASNFTSLEKLRGEQMGLGCCEQERENKIEKNSLAVPELGSWCHLDPRTLNRVFLVP
jgi:hypothetical protein